MNPIAKKAHPKFVAPTYSKYERPLQERAIFSPTMPNVVAVAFISCIATFIQSFLFLKASLLGVFVVTSALCIAVRSEFHLHARLLLFYLAIATTGAVWCLIGLEGLGNYEQGVFDAFKLYVLWSFILWMLYSLIREMCDIEVVHAAFLVSALCISAINLLGLMDKFMGLDVLPTELREELDLYVGIHGGYTQITSQNIGALFIIVPYLISIKLTKSPLMRSRLVSIALILALLTAALSGRRGLWLVIILTPPLIVFVAWVSRKTSRLRFGLKGFLSAYIIVLGLGVIFVVAIMPDQFNQTSSLEHFASAFEAEDARVIQQEFLLQGFSEAPLLGSGFGAYAGYLRNELRPWTYELTYHQLVFNVGIIGALIFAILFITYGVLIIGILRRDLGTSSVGFSLLVGVLSLFVGAASNPYLRSFDYLFLAGIYPFLATFLEGYGHTRTKMEESAVRN